MAAVVRPRDGVETGIPARRAQRSTRHHCHSLFVQGAPSVETISARSGGRPTASRYSRRSWAIARALRAAWRAWASAGSSRTERRSPALTRLIEPSGLQARCTLITLSPTSDQRSALSSPGRSPE